MATSDDGIRDCGKAELFIGVEGVPDSVDGSIDDHPSRSVSFHEPLTTTIHFIPLRSPEETAELFYNREDFADFQAKEQRRYDKMMMKRIQEMVQEAMKDQLEAAYARNATPEEIDAMMPQTTEEIFLLLGGMAALDMPKPPSAVKVDETLHHCKPDSTTVQEEGNPSDVQQQHEHQHKDAEKHEDATSSRKLDPNNNMEEISDDALHDIMEMEKAETTDPTSDNSEDNSVFPSGKETKQLEISEESADEIVKRQKRERHHRPDHWVEVTDDELQDLFLPLDEDEPVTATKKYKELTSRESIEEELNVVVHQKFHLGNDDPSELALLEVIEKNTEINDVLGTSFSSEVHFDDLVPLSPTSRPRTH
ncbi:hypothetical protein IV203_030131 [Nitzschia inconspicua]|uniref:Uncharacterized protein n=1 Tax=Nitzschia inconspicua TaxID=303405 RepID=A0A9K3LS14_9STRA|nr:hypothetical protein IV203_030131 [Nitzschia inconspicua]